MVALTSSGIAFEITTGPSGMGFERQISTRSFMSISPASTALRSAPELYPSSQLPKPSAHVTPPSTSPLFTATIVCS